MEQSNPSLFFLAGALSPTQLVQRVSCAFPSTYGINAARQAINGASLLTISPNLALQLAMGIVSVALGYLFFESFEHTARKTGKMEDQ